MVRYIVQTSSVDTSNVKATHAPQQTIRTFVSYSICASLLHPFLRALPSLVPGRIWRKLVFLRQRGENKSNHLQLS